MVAEKCRGAGWGCLDCKRVLADNMIATLAPIRARALELKAAWLVDQILATARRPRGGSPGRRSGSQARMGFFPASTAAANER